MDLCEAKEDLLNVSETIHLWIKTGRNEVNVLQKDIRQGWMADEVFRFVV